jgi:flagellar basal-body rod protein FlgB
MDLITSLTSQVMDKALDGLAKRHKAIASNLANVDTPNYRRRDVSFEGTLMRAMAEAREAQSAQRGTKMKQALNDVPLPLKTTRAEHIPIPFHSSLDGFQPEITENDDLQYRNDGNSVDVESEMAQLAKNTQRYLAIANLESRYNKSLRSIINGGGG